ncbi:MULTISPECIES: hypothetical protein [Pseudomonas]
MKRSKAIFVLPCGWWRAPGLRRSS